MNKFVLVGTQRSGTTLLRTLLNSHPEILCLGETFLIQKGKRKKTTIMGKGLGKNFSSWKSLSYQNYLGHHFLRRFGHYVFRQKVMHRYLEEIYSVPGYKAIGFKLMANQLRSFPSLIPYINTHDVKVVHVIRENTFAILLSRLVMEARGFAHATSEDKHVTTVTVPTSNLIKRLEEIRNAGLYWNNIFSDCPFYTMITYESLVEKRTSVTRDVLKFIGVDPGIELKSELVRSNKAPISEVVENIEEVRACLNGTEFESSVS